MRYYWRILFWICWALFWWLIGMVIIAYPPGGTSARDAPVAVPAGRFVKRGAYMICVTCGMAIEYCRGHAAPDASTAQDGAAAASLDARINECKGR